MGLPKTYVSDFHDNEAVQKMEYSILGDTGMEVSKLSFGASSLGSVFRETDEGESLRVVQEALRNGINYIDTAPWYGHGKAEKVLGKALKTVPRSSYYISTKTCRYESEVDRMFDFSAERTLRSVDESLHRLGLDYVDVIQVHDIEFAPSLDVVINETLPALQKVKDAGKARFIGITGYPLGPLKEVIERSDVRIDTILTYCRASMNDNCLADYIPFFKSNGIGIVNASPISMGLLSNRGAPSWHPASDNIKTVCKKAADYCKSRNVDISKLAMEFTLSQPDIHTTLVSTASCANLMKNIRSVYTPLTQLEKHMQREILEKFMKPLKNQHWEGAEVEQYRDKLSQMPI